MCEISQRVLPSPVSHIDGARGKLFYMQDKRAEKWAGVLLRSHTSLLAFVLVQV